METVSDIVLESGVVVLTGGIDRSGCRLLTVPADSADLLELYSSRDILKLMEVYEDMCGDQVAVLASIRHGWTDESTGQLFKLLGEITASRKKHIKRVYILTPKEKDGRTKYQRLLTRVNLRDNQITWFDDISELSTYIDTSQLTPDFGGTLLYNHVALVDFHRSYVSVQSEAREMASRLKFMMEEVLKDNDASVNGDMKSDRNQKNILCKEKLKRLNTHGVIEDCQDAIERLEHPECDPGLMKCNPLVLAETVRRLKHYVELIDVHVQELEQILTRSNSKHGIMERLKDCAENTKEVEETIDLMMQQVEDLPLVGESSKDAQHYRDVFIATVLLPSKDIVSCASSIIQDLNCGPEASQASLAFAEGIARRLTSAVQPFTYRLNAINEKYIRIHLFHVIFRKTNRWKYKASKFIHRTLNVSDIQNTKQRNERRRNFDRSDISNIFSRNGPSGSKHSTRLNKITNPAKEQWSKAPNHWSQKLEYFYQKHPPPKKRHLKLLNYSVPTEITEALKSDAEFLAERTLFILQFLGRNRFKEQDIRLISSWTAESVEDATEV